MDYSLANDMTTITTTTNAKTCRCSGNSNLGSSLNATITKIVANNFNTGLGKIIVVLVATTSLDDVQFASEYARAIGITIVVIAIGNSYDNTQVLQLASTSSNLLLLSGFSLLDTFPSTFQNFLNKQYMDVLAGSTLTGAVVRVPSNPNYFRVPRSTIGG